MQAAGLTRQKEFYFTYGTAKKADVQAGVFGNRDIEDRMGNPALNQPGEEEASSKGQPVSTADLMQVLTGKRQEILEKLRRGETETSYAIGGSSFTEKEWERLIEKVDAVLDAVREAMEEEQKRAEKLDHSVMDRNEVKSLEEIAESAAVSEGDFLVSETTRCSYPAAGEDEEQEWYVVCYTSEGISCMKCGEDGVLWQIPFTDETQYQKVMDFIDGLDPAGNYRFTAHRNFWEDFLSGELNVEEFLDFYGNSVNGVPNYLTNTEYGMRIDEKALKYQPYFTESGIREPGCTLPDFVADYYATAEEFFKAMEAKMAERQASLPTLEDTIEEYYRLHPSERGKKMYWWDGVLYTYGDFMRVTIAAAQKAFDDYNKEHGITESVEKLY